jgi:hypothetical protein
VGLGGGLGIDVQTADYSAEQIYATDPPPTSCDGGGMPPPVTGTPECPSDKNLPGCPCSPVGQMAACWTGLRKDRGHGDCKDGMTECTMVGESAEWGPCVGEVLPTGTTGKAACQCFSGGYWKIDNLSPCFLTDETQTMVTGCTSTYLQGTQPVCDTTAGPSKDWSTDSLETDCAGEFTLCYTIKAGNGKSPQPTDCVVGQSCVTAHYPGSGMVNTTVPFPNLPGWTTNDLACAQTFYTSGGYGQMSVNGQSDECELVDKVFQTVTYCPIACNANPSAPGCAGCMPGGGGSF